MGMLAACSKDTPSAPSPYIIPRPSPPAALTAVPPPPPKAYSEWKVGNDSFRSNNVRRDEGKLITILSCSDPNAIGNYHITFHFGLDPTKTYFNLCDPDSNRKDCTGIGFYSKGSFYLLHHSGYLLRDTGARIQFRLVPTWFVNYDNPQDTVLISGIFRDP